MKALPSTTGSVPEGERRLGRGIDYLGAIARMLRDLTGFSTLAYELIQNADDAPGATVMRFDVGQKALVVWNDGQFEDCGHQELHPDLPLAGRARQAMRLPQLQERLWWGQVVARGYHGCLRYRLHRCLSGDRSA
jgi:hypothetical protein